MKLKYKLSIIVIAIMVAVVSIISYSILSRASEVAYDVSIQSVQNLAEREVEHWEGELDYKIGILETMANIMSDYESMPADERRERIDHMLLSVLNSEPDITLIYSIWKPNAIDGNDARYIGRPGSSPTGQYAMTYSREEGKITPRASKDIPAHMEWYNGPSSKKVRFDNPMPRTVNGQDAYVMIVMFPIVNPRTNETVGGVGFLMNMNVIQPKVLETVKKHDEVDALTIFSQDGTIMGHIVPARLGKTLLESEKSLFGDNLEIANRAVAEGKEYFLHTFSGVLKSDVQVVLKPVKIKDSDRTWSIMIVSSDKHVFAPIHKIRNFTIVAAIIAIGITTVILFFVLSGIVSHIVEVTDAIKDISEGEGDLTHKLKADGKDEIGDLARYFNKFMLVLRDPISEAKATVDTLASVSEELSSVSRQLASGSEETANQSNTVASTTEQMAVNINAMVSAAEEASVNASEVAGAAEEMSVNMNTIAAAIEEMSASISEIANNADDARKVAIQAMGKATNATDVMGKLGAAAKEIGQVTNVIKNIADKTNLLALNATIEAASAGEAGKGFAVVAGEIKELANQSAKSADDIASRIDSIQSGTGDAVNVINDVSDIIVKINSSVEAIAGHVDQQTKASNEIANNVAQANTGSKRVAGSIGEVAKGANDVSRNAGEAAKGAHNVSSNISGMSQAAKDSAAGASQVSQSAGDLSRMAGQLRAAMDKFKV